MRTPGLPTLAVTATFIGCTFMLVVLNSSNNRRHTTHLSVHHGAYPYNEKQHPDNHHGHETGKPQQEELSVFDPVGLQMHNISDPANNQSSKQPIIQEKTLQAEEKKDSLSIFFILLVIVLATLLVHLILITEFYYMPEPLAIVLLGAVIGFILSYSRWDWREVESFNSNIFFLALLPPIIFEQGYTVNKGNFFANIIPILTFAIIGTAVTALIMSSGIYFFGRLGLIYRLSAIECFAFGSILSAVDPVITLAIFQALKVEPQLYMLAFGESMLNDAVAIVLTSTAMQLNAADLSHVGTLAMLKYAVGRFMAMFFVSALLGIFIGVISALLYKHINLRRTPALEMALLLVFAYLPYGLAETLELSGIMAILSCAITMSQYTHFNLTPMTQLTMQMTFRTLSFVAETSVFSYLGLALFSIRLIFQPAFLICSIVLIFLSRAANIFPLSFLINKCLKNNQISIKNQVIMWFSGMRGAVSFALALHAANFENKQMILTSTLFIVLFSIVFMGGSALPLIKILDQVFPTEQLPQIADRTDRRPKTAPSTSSSNVSRKSRRILLSKTREMNEGIAENETMDPTDARYSTHREKGFLTKVNDEFVRPLLIRNLSRDDRVEDRLRIEQMVKALRIDDGENSNYQSNYHSENEDHDEYETNQQYNSHHDQHPLLSSTPNCTV
ncbi:Sodium/hydrogen exchanger [Aphelenchoides besseyi]|nr:Sodium/hydrogen exchanger [Aphelenchoides besseyi]